MVVFISDIVLGKSFRLWNLLLIWFLFCLVYVIGSDASAKEKTRPWTKIQIFADNGFEPKIEGLRVEGAVLKDDIIKRFGKPLHYTSIHALDRDPSVINDILTWEYNGLTIILNGPKDLSDLSSEADQYWISKIILTSPDYSLKYALKIDQTRQAFLKELGKPDQEIDGIFIYEVTNYATIGGVDFAGHIKVWVEFDKNGKARKIIWEHYGD